jgi:hypothetical protein
MSVIDELDAVLDRLIEKARALPKAEGIALLQSVVALMEADQRAMDAECERLNAIFREMNINALKRSRDNLITRRSAIIAEFDAKIEMINVELEKEGA